MDPTQVKEWWKSKGAVGSLVAVVAIVFGYMGYAVTPDLQADAVKAWADIVAIGGALSGLIGRITATKRVVS